jgi:hypothetical protein
MRAGKNLKIIRQKEDRNLIPNTVHHIIAFVQKKFKSERLAKKIFSTKNPPAEASVCRFYVFHKFLRVKINTYVNETALKLITEVGHLEGT